MDGRSFHERWPSTRRTCASTCTDGSRTGGTIIDARNGDTGAPIDLEDVVVIETTDGKQHRYEIVSIVTDPDTETNYGVGHDAEEDKFVVFDERGNLLADEELANEILEDFLTFAEESASEDGT